MTHQNLRNLNFSTEILLGDKNATYFCPKITSTLIILTVQVVLSKINLLFEYRWKTRLGIICLPKYTHCNRLSCSLFTRKPCPDAKRGQTIL